MKYRLFNDSNYYNPKYAILSTKVIQPMPNSKF